MWNGAPDSLSGKVALIGGKAALRAWNIHLRDVSGKNIRKQLEVDFVVNRASERFYIQSALSIADPEKKEQEIASLIRIPDSFRKIVIVKDYIKPWKDENGIQYIGIEDFLLDEKILC